LELEVAKEILAELYDIRIWQVEDLIMQHIGYAYIGTHARRNLNRGH